MSATTISRSDVLAAIDTQRAWWEGVLTEVGEERMEQSNSIGDWSFKDVVAHLSGWQRRTLDRLESVRTDHPIGPTPWPVEYNDIADEDEQVEKINDWIYQQNRDRPLADVLAETRAQWDELREIVGGLPDDVLNDTTRIPGLEGESIGQAVLSGSLFDHFHGEHEPGIREWLDSAGSA